MMPLTDEEAGAIDAALSKWRQGDVVVDADLLFMHVANLGLAHSPESEQLVASDPALRDEESPQALLTPVPGLIMLTQTCDAIRDCRQRPFVEVAPLVEVSSDQLEQVRRGRRPQYVYVPGVAQSRLVADLERTMTVEKGVVAGWTRIAGCRSDDEARALALGLSRKRSRVAFSDSFVEAVRRLQSRILEKHNRQSDEGAHLRALREIRVRAAPSWEDRTVRLTWWFIKDVDPEDAEHVDWAKWTDYWMTLFNSTPRFQTEAFLVARLEDMTALDYIESDQLDLDRLSTGD